MPNPLFLLWQRLLFHLRRDRLDRELEEEMRFHLDQKTEENVAAGLSPQKARQEAQRQFGNQTLLREMSREMWGFRSLKALAQDLRQGLRMMGKNPGFTAVAAITLALGIGANTAIFSVVNAVLLRPLPYREPGRLVEVWESYALSPGRGAVAPANFFDWQQRSDVFEWMAGLPTDQQKLDFALLGQDQPERVRGLGVTGELFSVLGIKAELGRTFRPEETWKGKNQVVVLSHGLWKRRFGGDPNIIGQSISLDGRSYAIVGVMPDGFYFPRKDVELWVPFGFDPAEISKWREGHSIRVIARLKAGVTIERAQAQMNTIAGRLEQEYPATNTNWRVGVGLLHDRVVSDTRRPLLTVLAAVGFILLIACANIANLLLARAATRTREIAIRAALGAGRLRLVRQLLTESLLIAAIGGGLGLVLAYWGKHQLLAFRPGNIPRFDEITIDERVFSFTLGTTLLTTLVFGLVPALASSRVDLSVSLKESGQQAGVSIVHRRARNLFVVLEVAFALMLLIGAGLMIRSFIRLEQVNPGFDPDRLLALRISLPSSKYENPAHPGLLIGFSDYRSGPFYEKALERIKNLPGVIAAGATDNLPLQGAWSISFTIEGRPPENYDAVYNIASADYFRTMEVPLISGRAFADYDNEDHPRVVVVNEALALRVFGAEDPVGKRLKPTYEDIWYTIVGIVKNERPNGLGSEAGPEVYGSYLQNPFSQVALVVRTERDPNTIVNALRSAIWELDKDVTVYDVTTMKEVLYGSISRERFTVLLLAIFAAVALILSSVGVYGVMSYSVTQRTREIGLRLAMGASPRAMVKMVVGQGARLALLGACLGLIGALGLTRLMSSLLFGISATDPATFAGVAIVLMAISLLASLVPARRAANVDPVVALRGE